MTPYGHCHVDIPSSLWKVENLFFPLPPPEINDSGNEIAMVSVHCELLVRGLRLIIGFYQLVDLETF